MSAAQSGPDYSLIDRRGLARWLFYPRRDVSGPPAGAVDHRVEVEAGVQVAGRFHPCDRSKPTLLLFHGNGEIASDYDMIAPAYHGIGAIQGIKGRLEVKRKIERIPGVPRRAAPPGHLRPYVLPQLPVLWYFTARYVVGHRYPR